MARRFFMCLFVIAGLSLSVGCADVTVPPSDTKTDTGTNPDAPPNQPLDPDPAPVPGGGGPIYMTCQEVADCMEHCAATSTSDACPEGCMQDADAQAWSLYEAY